MARKLQKFEVSLNTETTHPIRLAPNSMHFLPQANERKAGYAHICCSLKQVTDGEANFFVKAYTCYHLGHFARSIACVLIQECLCIIEFSKLF